MASISTRNIQQLLGISDLKRLLQSLSVLDLIMSPEYQDRYYSFDSHWGENETMGFMNNGSGDCFIALFNSAGCFINGSAHEYPLFLFRGGRMFRDRKMRKQWKRILKKVPSEFSSAFSDSRLKFTMMSRSFCFWRFYDNGSWICNVPDTDRTRDPDGSEFLLRLLDPDPRCYQVFAKEYYEEDIPLSPICHIYGHAPLTQEVIDLLNKEVKLDAIEDELLRIGYPENGNKMPQLP